ncbi:TIGR03032 family protein [Pelagibacteraceae bacterium]|nr:TIGR03032 family protein [Pelagibacteraceae bacterium]
MSISSNFNSFSDITQSSKNKKIVLFGAGEIAKKTIQRLDDKPSFIVDNNPNMQSIIDNDLEVKNPEILLNLKNETVIIICTTSFDEVSNQLTQMGYKKGKNFFNSPIMNDLLIIEKLAGINTEIIFSSGAPSNESPDYGGGIYKLSIRGNNHKLEKKINGTSHGIIKLDNYYIASNHEHGIIKFDSNFNIEKKISLPNGSRPHGICFSKVSRKYYVVASYRDSFFVINENFELEKEVFISKKFSSEGEPAHHCNDICTKDNSIYISMFSSSGNWKNDVFDGCIMEFDLNSMECIGNTKDNLWMPHNVSFIDGGLVVLDSLRGHLLKNNLRKTGEFPGFTRGLYYDGSLFFIGQSRNRNFSKYLGDSLNISIDTSIIIFDEKTKVSRSIQLDSRISEIHSIIA